jgi:hypothetical protein
LYVEAGGEWWWCCVQKKIGEGAFSAGNEKGNEKK